VPDDIQPVVESKPAPKAEENPPPVWGPLLALTKSKKGLVLIFAVIGGVAMVLAKAATIQEAGAFVGVIATAWTIAQGGVDKANAEKGAAK
jgi:hypothetical protein